MGCNVTHTILYFYNLASPRTKRAARAGAAFLVGAFLAVLATACSPAYAGAGHGTIRTKPRGPVLVTPKSEAVAAPTDERGFFTPEFLPMPEIRLRTVLGAGSAYPQGRRQGFGLVTTPRAHQFRPSQALDGFLVTPEGAKTMTATPVASAAARTPTNNALNFEAVKTTSEAQAFALLQATSDATMAKLYLSRGNIPAARRKAVQLLKALQSLEVTA